MTPLIDPFNFTKFDRTDAELEAMVLFSIMVANKRADQTYEKFAAFMECPPLTGGTPFERVRELDRGGLLGMILKHVRAGQYRRIARAFREVVNVNLRTCTVDDLEAVHGIGPKTARMFLLHSRPDQQIAVLDTHILAYLHEQGVPRVPRSTPSSGPNYLRLEQAFLRECNRRACTPAELDLAIWNERTRSQVAPR